MAFKTISSDSNIPSTSNTSSSLCDALWSIDYSTKDSLTAATTTTPAEKGTKVVGDEIVPYENRIISPTLLSIAAQHPIYVAGTLNVTSKLTYLLRFPTMTLSSSDTPHLPPSQPGDSHCLPPSWSVIYAPVSSPAVSLTGQGLGEAPRQGLNEDGGSIVPRLLIPRLVTGVKQWHLRSGQLSSPLPAPSYLFSPLYSVQFCRLSPSFSLVCYLLSQLLHQLFIDTITISLLPEGTFYPKLNFQSAMQHIPDGSDVIFLIGEIDCREGNDA